jgi:hypothetical protein
MQLPHDHFSAVYKQYEHNSYSLSTIVTVLPCVITSSSPVIPAFPPVIPAKAGIHCGGIFAWLTKSDLLEYV